MKVILEKDEFDKLVKMYVKSKLKVDVDFFESSIAISGGAVYEYNTIEEFKLAIRPEEK